jgi:hypothetical protein
MPKRISPAPRSDRRLVKCVKFKPRWAWYLPEQVVCTCLRPSLPGSRLGAAAEGSTADCNCVQVIDTRSVWRTVPYTALPHSPYDSLDELGFLTGGSGELAGGGTVPKRKQRAKDIERRRLAAAKRPPQQPSPLPPQRTALLAPLALTVLDVIAQRCPRMDKAVDRAYAMPRHRALQLAVVAPDGHGGQVRLVQPKCPKRRCWQHAAPVCLAERSGRLCALFISSRRAAMRAGDMAGPEDSAGLDQRRGGQPVHAAHPTAQWHVLLQQVRGVPRL